MESTSAKVRAKKRNDNMVTVWWWCVGIVAILYFLFLLLEA